MRKLFIVIFATGFCSVALAEENTAYHCTQDNHERIIEVVYETSDNRVPCKVQYQKDGQTDVLWTFNNEKDQCEHHAQAFMEKQREWGWDCQTKLAAE